MTFLNRLDHFLGKSLAWFSLGTMILGVLFPDTFAFLSSMTFGLFAFVTFASSLGAGFTQVRQVLLHPLPLLTVFLVQHLVMPVLTLLIGRLCFPANPDFVTGLVLQNSIPSAVAALMWVSVAGGTMALSLVIILLDTLLSPFVVPLTLKLLLGSTVEMDGTGIMKNLLFMVAIPALAAMLLNQLTHGRITNRVQPALAPFSKIALIVVMLSNSTGVADYIRHLNPLFLAVIVVGVGIMALGFFIGGLAGRLIHAESPDSVAIMLNAGMRNINAGASLAIAYFSSDVLFPVVTCALSMHVLAAASVAVFRRTKAGRPSPVEK